MYDIVYVLKNDIDSEELVYSLRSLSNFPHNKVWFYGGNPKGLTPDEGIFFQQSGGTKWERVRNSLIDVCKNDDITENFWLFNDDFFVMKKFERDPRPFIQCSIYYHYTAIEKRHNYASSSYTRGLRFSETKLKERGYDTLDYALHIPMLFNREKLYNTFIEFPQCHNFRSVYGNRNHIGGILHRDVKITSFDREPDDTYDFLSTTEKSFKYGAVGDYIRNSFPEKSRFEIGE